MATEDLEVRRCFRALVAEAYCRYKTFWINLARTSLLSAEDGEDLVHGILGSILGREDLSFESLDHVRNYVARAVLNRAIQIKQRGGRMSEFDEETVVDNTAFTQQAILEQQEESMALRAVIRDLSQQDYEIIKLRFFVGLTFVEISRMLSVPVSTLKSREDAAIRRIRRGMRHRISD
jgi:RNA polymerase sigma factor (sigma-70 family)